MLSTAPCFMRDSQRACGHLESRQGLARSPLSSKYLLLAVYRGARRSHSLCHVAQGTVRVVVSSGWDPRGCPARGKWPSEGCRRSLGKTHPLSSRARISGSYGSTLAANLKELNRQHSTCTYRKDMTVPLLEPFEWSKSAHPDFMSGLLQWTTSGIRCTLPYILFLEGNMRSFVCLMAQRV